MIYFFENISIKRINLLISSIYFFIHQNIISNFPFNLIVSVQEYKTNKTLQIPSIYSFHLQDRNIRPPTMLSINYFNPDPDNPP